MSSDQMRSQNLYGDHMVIQLPADARDISDVREVPDNQEVYTHSITDQSIIIEILEYVQEEDQQALRTHYSDIADSNDAETNFSQVNLEVVPADQLAMNECQAAYIMVGEQDVAKFKEHVKNKLQLYVALFRLPQFETDILMTFNNPINVNPESSSHAAIPTSSQPWTPEQFKLCVTSLKILKPGLFG